MKKYFMKGTDEEVQFGDKIELDLTKETKGGIEYKSMTIKFSPLFVDILKEENVIEEKEAEDEEEGLDFSKFFASLKEKKTEEETLEEKLDILEDRLTELEGVVAELTNKKSR